VGSGGTFSNNSNTIPDAYIQNNLEVDGSCYLGDGLTDTLTVQGPVTMSSDLTVTGTIWQGIQGPSASESVMDAYNDVHNLHLYDYGRYSEMDAPIFANEQRTIIDTNKLRQLEHGAIRQLSEKINKLKQRLDNMVEENRALKQQLNK
jgi:hypothetical protein